MNSHFADAAAGEAPREFTPGARTELPARLPCWCGASSGSTGVVDRTAGSRGADGGQRFRGEREVQPDARDMHHDGSDGMTMFSVMQSAVSMPLPS